MLHSLLDDCWCWRSFLCRFLSVAFSIAGLFLPEAEDSIALMTCSLAPAFFRRTRACTDTSKSVRLVWIVFTIVHRCMTDPLNRQTSFTYDQTGNVISVTRLAGTANAVTTNLSYVPNFYRLTGVSAPGADDVRAGRTCELARHRTDYAGRTVHEDALPRTKATVLEQPLPGGQARHYEGRPHREVNIARQRCEVACLDGHVLRQRAVAIPVREAEHPLSNRQPRRAISESGDHSGQFVSGD